VGLAYILAEPEGHWVRSKQNIDGRHQSYYDGIDGEDVELRAELHSALVATQCETGTDQTPVGGGVVLAVLENGRTVLSEVSQPGWSVAVYETVVDENNIPSRQVAPIRVGNQQLGD